MPSISNVSLSISPGQASDTSAIDIQYNLTQTGEEVTHGPSYQEVISLAGNDLGGEGSPFGAEQSLGEISRRWLTRGPAGTTRVARRITVATRLLAEDPDIPSHTIRVWQPFPLPGHWTNVTIPGAQNQDEIIAHVVLEPPPASRVTSTSNERTGNFG